MIIVNSKPTFNKQKMNIKGAPLSYKYNCPLFDSCVFMTLENFRCVLGK